MTSNEACPSLHVGPPWPGIQGARVRVAARQGPRAEAAQRMIPNHDRGQGPNQGRLRC